MFFFFSPKLSSGGECGGEEGESSLGPKLMASPLSLTLESGESGEGAPSSFVPTAFSKCIFAAARTWKSMTEGHFERQAVADG